MPEENLSVTPCCPVKTTQASITKSSLSARLVIARGRTDDGLYRRKDDRRTDCDLCSMNAHNRLYIYTGELIWGMASGAAKNRMLEQKRFFSRKNDAQSVANGDSRRVEI